MDVLIRESAFGRIANYITNGHALPYPYLGSSSSIQNGPFFPAPLDNNKVEGIAVPAKGYKLVTWSGTDDSENPYNWPTNIKTVVTLQIMLLNFSFYLASAEFTPSIAGLEADFGANTAEGTLGLSLFVIAYGIGPLILSPLSGMPAIGRTIIYLSGLLAFCVLNIGIANANNIETVLVLRFLAGLLGSAPISTGGASLSEFYGPEQRAYAISLYAVSGVAGPVLGPIIGTLAVQRWNSWAATAWLMAGLSGFAFLVLFFSLRETLAQNILLRRARCLRTATGDVAFRCQAEIDHSGGLTASGVGKQIVDDLVLPLVDPILLFVNLHVMLLYSLLYLWFEYFPFVFSGIYGFTHVQQALAFFGILVGTVLSASTYTLWLRYHYDPLARKLGSEIQPEARLRPAQFGAVSIPICLFIFARSSRPSVHWIVPIIGTAFFAPGFYLTFQSTLNYLGDAYPRHVGSVFAGNTFFRSSIGGALPLAAPAMLRTLGIGWACSILGFISVIMLPIPFVLERYGARLRAWSKYAD